MRATSSSLSAAVSVSAEHRIRLLPPLTLTAAESYELVARISDLVVDFLKTEGVVAA